MIDLINRNGICIAELKSEKIEINSTQDALDIMVNCGYSGADAIIIKEGNILPEFFDLKTGVAGDILQKFSNYRMSLAIIGDFSKYTSKSLQDFIFESNKSGKIIFTKTVDEAVEKFIRST